MQLLKEKQHNRTQLAFDPIDITDPEQFVPLFVARTGPEAAMSCEYYGKPDLIRLLNHPYPKQYRFVTHYDSTTLGSDDDTAMYSRFSGRSYGKRFKNTDVGLGYVIDGIYNYVYTVIKSSPLYPAWSYDYANLTSLTPRLLVVIKAKHIPYMRARMFLGLKTSLPLGDMKWLFNISTTGMVDRIRNYTRTRAFLESQQPIIESVDTETLLKYLIPKINYEKSALQSIEDTLEVMLEGDNEY